MITDTTENRTCQICQVVHPDGIMHIAAATQPVRGSFGPAEDQKICLTCDVPVFEGDGSGLRNDDGSFHICKD